MREPAKTSPSFSIGLILMSLLAVGVAVTAVGFFESRLLQHWHVSGWLLFAYAAVLCVCFVAAVRRASRALDAVVVAEGAVSEPPPSPPQPPMAAVMGMLALYLVHTGLRVPRGGMEWVLAFLFAAFVASSVAGRLWPQRAVRCLFIQLTVAYTLLPLALLHGVLAHAHGLLAHQAGMKA